MRPANATRREPPRRVEVAIVGGGMSGLCTAMMLARAGVEDFHILEKTGDLGGTWRDNTYPGAACDVPAMFYCFSFEQKVDWSHKYPEQPEIQDYLRACADKYGLWERTSLNTEVTEAAFDEKAGLWHLHTADGSHIAARVLVFGVGQLNRPYVPDMAGLDAFAGHTFPCARWEHAHDLTGERVAVIGNGASAIQFIPEIAREAKRLSIFQRSANWMIARKDRAYTAFEHWLFRRVPGVARLVRNWLWLKHEMRWPVFARASSWIGRLFEWLAARDMRKQVHDPSLHDALVPDYPIGCKRILISDDYYPALNRNNVELVTAGIERFTRDGIITADGAQRAFDTVIFATGFKSTEFLAPMTVRGLGGLDLHTIWRDGAEAYLGMTVPRFPNMFLLYGPNTNLGHNSIIFMIEQQARYIGACVTAIRRRRLKYLDLRPDAMQRWNEEAQASLAKTVWATSCQSWYKTADGRITNNWPYSTAAYWWRMRHPRLADYRQVPEEGGAIRSPRTQPA